MSKITSVDALEALYPPAVPVSLSKVQTRLTPIYEDWIKACRFAVLSTVGPEGVDSSPRGEDGPVVTIKDDRTLLMPDWPGNNRLDSLRNVIRDPRVSLMFLIPGQDIVVRINGTAEVSTDEALRAIFRRKKAMPITVLKIVVEEAYFQCPRAIKRADLWNREAACDAVPSMSDFLNAVAVT